MTTHQCPGLLRAGRLTLESTTTATSKSFAAPAASTTIEATSCASVAEWRYPLCEETGGAEHKAHKKINVKSHCGATHKSNHKPKGKKSSM